MKIWWINLSVSETDLKDQNLKYKYILLMNFLGNPFISKLWERGLRTQTLRPGGGGGEEGVGVLDKRYPTKNTLWCAPRRG